MSNIIPPLVSSSPPPLDLIANSDDDDDFSDFNGVVKFPYISDDIPPGDVLEFPDVDLNRNEQEERKAMKDFHDKRKGDDLVNNVSNAIHENDLSEKPTLPNKVPIEVDLNQKDITDNDCISKDNETYVNGYDSAPVLTDVKVNSNEIGLVENVLNVDKSEFDDSLSTKSPTERKDSFDINCDFKLENVSQFTGDHISISTNSVDCEKIVKVNDEPVDFDEKSINFIDVNSKSSTESIPEESDLNVNSIQDVLQEVTTTKSVFDVEDYQPFPADSVEILQSDFDESPVLKLDEDIDDNNSEQSFQSFEYSGDNKELSIDDNSTENATNDFQTDFSVENVVEVTTNEDPLYNSSDNDDFGDFADFSCNVEPPTTTEIKEDFFPSETAPDDDFGDFGSFSGETAEIPSSSYHIDGNNVLPKSEEILREIFPKDEEPNEDYLDINEKSDKIFQEIRSLTDTNALSYQWGKSKTQQSLLKVLNVDTRNILYGPGWNSSMPIFAANLSLSPLEPQKTLVPQVTTASVATSAAESPPSVPCAQFDWATSGLTNPLDCSTNTTVLLDLENLVINLDVTPCNSKTPSPSEEIDHLESWSNAISASSEKEPTIPSIKPSKPYDTDSVNSLQLNDVIPETDEYKPNASKPIGDNNEFDVFTDFQSSKNETSSTSLYNVNMIPLRESYINTNDLDPVVTTNPETDLKLTEVIQETPESIPEKTFEFDENSEVVNSEVINSEVKETEVKVTEESVVNHVTDDDFTEFQASLPNLTLVESKLSTNRSIEYKLAIENPIEPELLRSNNAATILQPTVLKPMQGTSGGVEIVWPEPGITDDEIRKFEQYSYMKSEKSTTTTKKPETTQEKTAKKSEKPISSKSTIKTISSKVSIDDDWTDFQNAGKSSNDASELSLSITKLGALKPAPMLSRPLITSQGLVQTRIPSNNDRITTTNWSNNYKQPTIDSTHIAEPSWNEYNSSSAESFHQATARTQRAVNHQHVTQPIRHPSKTSLQTLAVDDEWSDFVSVAANAVPKSQDWSLGGVGNTAPNFTSWSTPAKVNLVSPPLPHFNGFTSYGQSATGGQQQLPTRLTSGNTSRGVGTLQTHLMRNMENTVSSISAMPELDFGGGRFGTAATTTATPHHHHHNNNTHHSSQRK